MSDVFFIISSICVVILTVLLSVLVYKLIDALDEVNQTIDKAKSITANISKAVAAISSVGAVASPLTGVVKKFLKKKKRGYD